MFPPFMRRLGPVGPRVIESLTISSVDTGITGYPFLVMSSNPVTSQIGYRIEQGAASTNITGIINNLVFVTDATGFAAGAAQVFEDSAGTPVNWDTFDVKLLGASECFYRSDLGITQVSGKVSQWNDQSGNGWNVTQGTAGNRPVYVSSDSNFNNKPSLNYDASAAFILLAHNGAHAGITAVDAFFVLSIRTDPPASSTFEGFCHFNDASTAKYPRASDGVVAVNCFSSAQKVTVNPSTSLTTPHLTELISTGSEYTWRLNGSQQFTTATNTVAWGSRIWLGVGDLAAATRFDGYLAEVIAYKAKLSTNYRTVFEYRTQTRYGIDVAGV